MKICTKCKETKDIEEFYKKNKNSTERQAVCKICRSKLAHDWYHKNKGQVSVRERQYRKHEKKISEFYQSENIHGMTYTEFKKTVGVCNTCEQVKSLEEFPSWRPTSCKACHSKNTKRYQERNREKVLAYKREYNRKERELSKLYQSQDIHGETYTEFRKRMRDNESL